MLSMVHLEPAAIIDTPATGVARSRGLRGQRRLEEAGRVVWLRFDVFEAESREACRKFGRNGSYCMLMREYMDLEEEVSKLFKALAFLSSLKLFILAFS